MTPRLCLRTTRASLAATAISNTRFLAGMLAGGAILGSSIAGAVDWNGSAGTDWNDPNNWDGAAVPSGADAAVNSIANNPAVISADISATPVDILVARGGGTTGILNHTAGTAQTGGGNWMFVGDQGGNGTYNLADTTGSGGTLTGFAQGSGTMNVGGHLRIGTGAGSVGVVNVNTSSTLAMGSDLVVGLSGGNGTYNQDSGTVTTGGWNLFGADAGTSGSVNIGGGSLTNNGTRTIVGRADGVAAMTISGGTYNNTTDNVETFFAIGVNNLGAATESSLTMTGGTLNTARRFSVGGMANGNGNDDGAFWGSGKGSLHVNGAGALLNSTGEFWVGQGAGSVGTATLTAGTIQVDNWVAIGRGGGDGTVNIDGGSFNKTGGGHFIVGDGSLGVLNQSSGAVNISSGELWVGQGGGSNGTYTMSGGSLEVGNWIAVGRNGGVGLLTLSGGTITKTGGGDVTIGSGNGGSGTLDATGGLLDGSASRLFVGENGSGIATLNVSGSAEVRTAEMIVGQFDTVTGIVNLDGGTLKAGSIHGLNSTSNVSFNGTQIVATGDNAGYITGLTSAVLNTGGLKLDSNGFNVASNQVFTGAGGLEKSGAGTLTLEANNSYSGKTTVAGGTLALSATGSIAASTTIEVQAGAVLDVSAVSGWTLGAGQSLQGPGSITAGAGGVILAGDVNPGSSPGTLTFNSDVTMSGTLNNEVTGGGSAADLIDVNGALVLSGSTLNLINLGTFTLGDKFTVAAYDSLSGSFANAALDDTVYTLGGDLWRIDYDDVTAGLNGPGDGLSNNGFITITAVPEPAVALLGGFGLLALLRRRRD